MNSASPNSTRQAQGSIHRPPLPFLKWAGGKRWFAERASQLIGSVKGRYFEPFLGSGAVFFELSPARAILSDANAELIETYRALKEDWHAVVSRLKHHDARHSKKHYYLVRASRPRSPTNIAARFIYLNRTCWNGLFRVNLSGSFNVPIGTKQNVLLDTDDFEAISKSLQKAELVVSDFEQQIDKAEAGDVVFADPPYTVRHNLNGFLKYNRKLFNWNDQVRLANCVQRAAVRGVRIICTNANHASVRALYRQDFSLSTVKRFSSIASQGRQRGQFSELIIRG